jgi:hypothetical protein
VIDFRCGGPSITDYQNDQQSLRLALARMDWVKALPDEKARREIVDKLADALMFALCQAKLGAPRMAPRHASSIANDTKPRKRKSGGGRKPAITRAILAADIERVFRELDLPATRTRLDGVNSPMLVVFAACWKLAEKSAAHPGKQIRDPRRMFDKKRRWVSLETRRATRRELRKHSLIS